MGGFVTYIKMLWRLYEKNPVEISSLSQGRCKPMDNITPWTPYGWAVFNQRIHAQIPDKALVSPTGRYDGTQEIYKGLTRRFNKDFM